MLPTNLRWRSVRRFFRYGCVGVGTFAIDLALLYTLTTYAQVAYYIATPLSFFVGVSINYAISRRVVFRTTMRSWHGGYAHFIAIALAGMFLTTSSVVLLVGRFGLHYLVARVLVAGCVGVCNYLLNLYWNFKVAGSH